MLPKLPVRHCDRIDARAQRSWRRRWCSSGRGAWRRSWRRRSSGWCRYIRGGRSGRRHWPASPANTGRHFREQLLDAAAGRAPAESRRHVSSELPYVAATAAAGGTVAVLRKSPVQSYTLRAFRVVATATKPSPAASTLTRPLVCCHVRSGAARPRSGPEMAAQSHAQNVPSLLAEMRACLFTTTGAPHKSSVSGGASSPARAAPPSPAPAPLCPPESPKSTTATAQTADGCTFAAQCSATRAPLPTRGAGRPRRAPPSAGASIEISATRPSPSAATARAAGADPRAAAPVGSGGSGPHASACTYDGLIAVAASTTPASASAAAAVMPGEREESGPRSPATPASHRRQRVSQPPESAHAAGNATPGAIHDAGGATSTAVASDSWPLVDRTRKRDRADRKSVV